MSAFERLLSHSDFLRLPLRGLSTDCITNAQVDANCTHAHSREYTRAQNMKIRSQLSAGLHKQNYINQT